MALCRCEGLKPRGNRLELPKAILRQNDSSAVEIASLRSQRQIKVFQNETLFKNGTIIYWNILATKSETFGDAPSSFFEPTTGTLFGFTSYFFLITTHLSCHSI